MDANGHQFFAVSRDGVLAVVAAVPAANGISAVLFPLFTCWPGKEDQWVWLTRAREVASLMIMFVDGTRLDVNCWFPSNLEKRVI